MVELITGSFRERLRHPADHDRSGTNNSFVDSGNFLISNFNDDEYVI